MFEVKDWEADVPTGTISFQKKPNKKKLKDSSKAKPNFTKQPQPVGFPTKPKKNKLRNKSKTPNKVSDNQNELNGNSQKVDNKQTPIKVETSSPGQFVRNPFLSNKRPATEYATSPKNKKRQKNKNLGDKNESKQNVAPKRKSEPNTNRQHSAKSKKQKFYNSDDINYNTDKLDEMLINVEKRKPDEAIKNEDQEYKLFIEPPQVNTKKQRLKQILELGRNSIKTNSNNLRDRMLEKLKAAQFRYLNEKLYTSSGSEAQQLFQTDPAAFKTYHEGYQLQVKKWPVNPLDVIIRVIKKFPKTALIADMGCGEAVLSKRVQQKVRSFDLVATAPGVETCDMAHTPLLTNGVDVVVYCLALMGTDLTQYLVEANRVLKSGGQLLIAEVESRFDDVDAFINNVQRLGFKLLKVDKGYEVFFFMHFKKVHDPPAKKNKWPALTLKPCLYKRR